MEKITRESLASIVVKRWKEQYRRDINTGSHWDEIYLKLKGLGSSPSPEEVNQVIGNNNWTKVPGCNECKEDSNEFVIRVGDEPDYESNTAFLCSTCIDKLQQLAAEK